VPGGGLCCAYCQHAFPLTWKRYFSSGRGLITCPECGAKSRIMHGVAYYGALCGTTILACIMISHFSLPKWTFVPFMIALAFFDRHLDANSKGMRGEQPPPSD